MRLLVLSLLTIMATTAGCATARNTLAQDLGWERWKTCDRFATIALDRIDLDGRLVVTGYEHEAAPFTACVREAAVGQSRRRVAAGPPWLAVRSTFPAGRPSSGSPLPRLEVTVPQGRTVDAG